MTDALAERFAALANMHDDSDWLDVRRRARRRGRVALPASLVAAAAVAAAAVAANGGWLFSGHGSDVMAVTHVTLHGQNWTVTLSEHKGGSASFFFVSASNGGSTSRSGRGDMASPHDFGPSFTASSAFVTGGQIWAGTTAATTVRVSITDYAGRVHSAATIAAPRATGTPYRYWAVAISGSPAATLTTYDANGKSTRWRLGMDAPS